MKRNTKLERGASIFIGGAMFGCLIFFVLMMTKKGWFEAKINYETILESGDGVRVGASVEMVGVRIGTVTSLELDEKNLIRTRIRVLRKFQDRIREDSRIMLARPFIMGDKTLHISPGNPKAKRVPENGLLIAEDPVGIMDLLNGRKLGPYFQTLELAAAEMKKLVDMLLKEKGSEKVVSSLVGLPRMISGVTTASRELSKVGRQMSTDEHIGTLVANLASTTEQIKVYSPEFGKDFSAIVANMSVLSEEFKKVIPALAVIAPDLPKSSQRLVQALDEAVIVLKAMQRSFLLRGSAREVREEELKLKEEQERKPASEEKAD